MPGTASAASSAAAARASRASVAGSAGVVQVERHGLRRRGGLGQAGVRVLRHHPGHRHRALGQRGEAGRVDAWWTETMAARCRGTRAGQGRGLRTARHARSCPAGAATTSEVPATSTASAASAPAARARAIRSARRSRASMAGMLAFRRGRVMSDEVREGRVKPEPPVCGTDCPNRPRIWCGPGQHPSNRAMMSSGSGSSKLSGT